VEGYLSAEVKSGRLLLGDWNIMQFLACGQSPCSTAEVRNPTVDAVKQASNMGHPD
jgi:hypothetical protein